ncbi:hypothetical protein Ndes2526B_g00666 [Nannochloris sp. 'desiccata']|nr:hypothetical protein KSW81_003962 [Chlorella desiccata (nom. nud.)]KAH7624466.1 hypothetical protein NADE_003818 [Chlorella desiccata (nom. nud.)]
MVVHTFAFGSFGSSSELNSLHARSKSSLAAQRTRQCIHPSPSSISPFLRQQRSRIHKNRLFLTSAASENGGTTTADADASSASPLAADDEFCALAYVQVDNKKNPNFTVMEIEVQDYPGLLRVVSWVLNGLELIAQNAILSTSADGVAYNTFWISSRSGKKLSDTAADLLAERVREFLSYCSPRPAEAVQTEFSLGPISVSNTEHSQYTLVKVREQERTPGFLLEVASVLSGLNVQVLQGVIQGCVDCGDDVPNQLSAQLESKDGARLFEFWVRNQDGQKLQVGHVRALLYALGIGLGIAGQRFPLTPPNREII